MSQSDQQSTGILTQPAGGFVDSDRACTKCSYNLRGLPLSGACPECGQPVADSLRGILLQFAGKEYLATVGGGLSIVLNVIIGTILLFIAMFAIAVLAGGGNPGAGMGILLQAIDTSLTLLLLYGVWRYTAPDPGFVGAEKPNSARAVVRIAVGIHAIAATMNLVLLLVTQSAVGTTLSGIAGIITMISGAAAVVAWFVQVFGVLRYTRWLASRIPDAYIIGRTKLYMWLLPVIAIVGAIVFLLGPLLALVMYWNLHDRLRKHFKSILATGSPAQLKKMAG